MKDKVGLIKLNLGRKSLSPFKGKMIKNSYAISLLSKITKGKAVVVTDVGQHQMWVAQYYDFKSRNRITSGGWGLWVLVSQRQ